MYVIFILIVLKIAYLVSALTALKRKCSPILQCPCPGRHHCCPLLEKSCLVGSPLDWLYTPLPTPTQAYSSVFQLQTPTLTQLACTARALAVVRM